MQTLEKVKNIIPLQFWSTVIVVSILRIEHYFITFHFDLLMVVSILWIEIWNFFFFYVRKFVFWLAVLMSIFFFFFLIYWQYKHWKKWKILFHYVLIYCDRVDPENWDIDRNICIEKSIFWFDLLISIFFWLIDNANIGKKWKILFHYFSTMIVMSILKIECYSITFHFDLL